MVYTNGECRAGAEGIDELGGRLKLTAQFRRQAAKLASVEPRRLSFSGVWTSFREILLYGQKHDIR